MPFMKSLRLDGLLSFAPGSEAIPLTDLNVLIGPNASGKSNLLEAISLMQAAPIGFGNAIRAGGGAEEWVWKGKGTSSAATIEAVVTGSRRRRPDLRYQIRFRPAGLGVEIVGETIEDAEFDASNATKAISHYHLEGGRYRIRKRRGTGGVGQEEAAKSVRGGNGVGALRLDESILSQRKEPDIYPELTSLGAQLGRIRFLRDWTLGATAPWRRPQPGDMPTDELLPDSSNLALVLNELEHGTAWQEFNARMKRFLPRFHRITIKVFAGSLQFFLHETGLDKPIPAARISDGTARFVTLLALLLSASPPPLVCIEEPEIGLHPDAVQMLADLLVEASSRMQVIVTTHSDALVSALTEQADSVLVCEHAGRTVVRRLESAKLKHWLDKYSLGDIWRIGELGGNP